MKRRVISKPLSGVLCQLGMRWIQSLECAAACAAEPRFGFLCWRLNQKTEGMIVENSCNELAPLLGRQQPV